MDRTQGYKKRGDLMKEIPLTKGFITIVDDDDYEYLNQFKWRAQGLVYAVRDDFSNGRANRKQIYMHREITGAKKGEVVDHLNHQTLDNRKSNIRVCSQTFNNANHRMRTDNTSGYKGVYWNKRDKKWTAQINFKGKNRNLGNFDSKNDAARMYNFWALDLFGEHALVNEINESEAV
jgi:hypothetical protein